MSAHRAPSARLQAPGGDDRASGPRSHHLLARQRYLLDDHKFAACPPPAMPPAPAACSRCAPQPAALLPLRPAACCAVGAARHGERSRTGQRTLLRARSEARALEGRLALNSTKMDAHGCLRRCTASHATPQCWTLMQMHFVTCTSSRASLGSRRVSSRPAGMG